MQTGIVKFFNPDKGFGFIKPDTNGEDMFVLVSNIVGGQLQENDRVQFEVEQGRKGPEATRVSTAK
jgi:CspA family cold shock protein